MSPMTGRIPAALLWIALVVSPAGTAAGWEAKSAGTGCVLESSVEELGDGYQKTTARILVNDKTVTVVSPSVLDPGFKDIGIAVDQEPLVLVDRLGDQRTAVFESEYANLVEQFKRGLKARVQLRFWPTWPATGTHSATFSLIGFTRAYAGLDACK